MAAELVLLVDDLVEVTTPPPGRRELKAGLRGRVLVAEGALAFGLVSVELAHPPRGARRVWMLRRRYLRKVGPPRPEVAALAADGEG